MIRTYQLISSRKNKDKAPMQTPLPSSAAFLFNIDELTSVLSGARKPPSAIKEKYYFYDYSTSNVAKLLRFNSLTQWKETIIKRTGQARMMEVLTYEKPLDRLLLRHLSFTCLHHQYTVFKCQREDTTFWLSLEKNRRGIIAQYSEGTDACSIKFKGKERENVKIRNNVYNNDYTPLQRKVTEKSDGENYRYPSDTTEVCRYDPSTESDDIRRFPSLEELIIDFQFCLPYSLTSSNCKDLAKFLSSEELVIRC